MKVANRFGNCLPSGLNYPPLDGSIIAST